MPLDHQGEDSTFRRKIKEGILQMMNKERDLERRMRNLTEKVSSLRNKVVAQESEKANFCLGLKKKNKKRRGHKRKRKNRTS